MSGALPPPVPAFKAAAKVFGLKGTGKFRFGVVVGAKNQDKTIRVAVNRAVLHLKYKKWIVKTKKYMVHDEKNECDIGDRVQIQMCAPHSKWKSWEVATIVRKDLGSDLILQNPEYASVPRELHEHTIENKNRKRLPFTRILVNGQVLKQTHEGAITDESNPLLQQVLREKRRQEKRALRDAKKEAEKRLSQQEEKEREAEKQQKEQASAANKSAPKAPKEQAPSKPAPKQESPSNQASTPKPSQQAPKEPKPKSK